MPLRFSAASSSDNKRALVAAAGAAACAARWRVGRGRAAPGTAPCAVYPPQEPRARGVKKRDMSAARPTVQTRDLWRRLSPPACAQLMPRSLNRHFALFFGPFCGGFLRLRCDECSPVRHQLHSEHFQVASQICLFDRSTYAVSERHFRNHRRYVRHPLGSPVSKAGTEAMNSFRSSGEFHHFRQAHVCQHLSMK